MPIIAAKWSLVEGIVNPFNGQTDGWTDRWADRWTDKWMDRLTAQCTQFEICMRQFDVVYSPGMARAQAITRLCQAPTLRCFLFQSLSLFHSLPHSLSLSLSAVPFQAVLLFMHFSLVLHARRANHMHFSRFLSLSLSLLSLSPRSSVSERAAVIQKSKSHLCQQLGRGQSWQIENANGTTSVRQLSTAGQQR